MSQEQGDDLLARLERVQKGPKLVTRVIKGIGPVTVRRISSTEYAESLRKSENFTHDFIAACIVRGDGRQYWASGAEYRKANYDQAITLALEAVCNEVNTVVSVEEATKN